MMDFPQFGMSTHIFGGFDPKVPLAGSRSQLRLMVWLGVGKPVGSERKDLDWNHRCEFENGGGE
jgi:hypothetical protein